MRCYSIVSLFVVGVHNPTLAVRRKSHTLDCLRVLPSRFNVHRHCHAIIRVSITTWIHHLTRSSRHDAFFCNSLCLSQVPTETGPPWQPRSQNKRWVSAREYRPEWYFKYVATKVGYSVPVDFG